MSYITYIRRSCFISKTARLSACPYTLPPTPFKSQVVPLPFVFSLLYCVDQLIQQTFFHGKFEKIITKVQCVCYLWHNKTNTQNIFGRHTGYIVNIFACEMYLLQTRPLFHFLSLSTYVSLTVKTGMVRWFLLVREEIYSNEQNLKNNFF